MLFLEELQKKNKANLTDLDKVIIKYIESDPYTVLHLTIEEFAEQCITTKSSIVKTLQKIGISGFKELKIKLMEKLKSKDENYVSTDECKETINNILSTDLLIKQSPIKNVAKLLIEKKKITIVAGGALVHLGSIFADQLNKLGIQCKVLSAEDPTFWSKRDEVYIFLSNSGLNDHIYNKAKYLKDGEEETNPTIISITAANTTNIASFADYYLPGSRLLLISKKEYHLPTTSVSIIWFILQKLVLEIFNENKQANELKISYM